jgi:CHASE1-domain containing sensor protein
MSGEEEGDNKWHMDKRVPIGIILAILFQTLGLVWYLAKTTTDVNNRLDNLEENKRAVASQESRIIVLEQNFSFIKTTLDRIERKLDNDGPTSRSSR